MKIFLIIIIALVGIKFVSAQEAAKTLKTQEIVKKPDNYTIQRLLIFNDKKEILLEKGINGWMTPALRSNENQSLKEGLYGLAKSIGISIKIERLAGVFTYQFNGLPDHKEVSYRTHYTAKYLHGQLIQPKDPNREYRWFPVETAVDNISNEALKAETNQIIKFPKTVWGGSFLYSYKDGEPEGIKMTEDFYSLSDN